MKYMVSEVTPKEVCVIEHAQYGMSATSYSTSIDVGMFCDQMMTEQRTAPSAACLDKLPYSQQLSAALRVLEVRETHERRRQDKTREDKRREDGPSSPLGSLSSLVCQCCYYVCCS